MVKLALGLKASCLAKKKKTCYAPGLSNPAVHIIFIIYCYDKKVSNDLIFFNKTSIYLLNISAVKRTVLLIIFMEIVCYCLIFLSGNLDYVIICFNIVFILHFTEMTNWYIFVNKYFSSIKVRKHYFDNHYRFE